jgi:hypothetical protein
MTTATAPRLMYATGPLATTDGDLVCELRTPAPAPIPRRATIVRCVDTSGGDVAEPVVLRGPLGLEALTLIVGHAATGAVDADRFSRRAFRQTCDWQDAHGRGAAVCRHLYALDRLATAAVKRDIPATVTWTIEGA